MNTRGKWAMILLSESVYYKVDLAEERCLSLSTLSGARMMNPIFAQLLKWKTKHFSKSPHDKVSLVGQTAFFSVKCDGH